MRTPALLLALLFAPSCVFVVDSDGGPVRLHSWSDDDGPRVRGNGVPGTERRSLDEVRRIEVRGHFDVRVEVGEAPSVEITGDSNVLHYVTTERSGDTLEIGLERGSYDLDEPLVVRVGTSALDHVALSGSGDVRVSGLAGGDLRVRLSGSGDVRLAGHVDTLEVRLSGSGDVDASDLAGDRASVRISGSGDVTLGDVPARDVEISGSGSVR